MPHSIHIVRQFHETFGHPIATHPTQASAETRLLRFRLLVEEVLEYGRAVGIAGLSTADQNDLEFAATMRNSLKSYSINPKATVDLAEAADALGDIDYVCQGANLVHGFPAEAVTMEIHRANMSKLGADGKPIYDAGGKVQKGPNYRKPDVAQVLKEFTTPIPNALVDNGALNEGSTAD